ncbi:MAG: transcriptional regulator with XRE-family HTH domain [Myxococcota bacterium]|jgi:transcriptional regulator with XRE-family HTH domain
MMVKSPPAFGSALRALRRDLQLSQEALASAVGSTQRHVSFLETGRSAPTRSMLGRIVTALRLTAAQRAALFAASGCHNPCPRRTLDDAEMQRTLDLIARQVLRHWPFPAFVVDRDWTFLRANGPGQRMFDLFDGVPNMHALFLSPGFQQLVENWEPASASFYTRIQEVAGRSALVRDALDAAVASGRFDHVASELAGTEDVPIYVPIVVRMPGQPRMRFTSLHGRLVSVHAAVAEGFEVELMVPLDESSEVPMQQLFG